MGRAVVSCRMKGSGSTIILADQSASTDRNTHSSVISPTERLRFFEPAQFDLQFANLPPELSGQSFSVSFGFLSTIYEDLGQLFRKLFSPLPARRAWKCQKCSENYSDRSLNIRFLLLSRYMARGLPNRVILAMTRASSTIDSEIAISSS